MVRAPRLAAVAERATARCAHCSETGRRLSSSDERAGGCGCGEKEWPVHAGALMGRPVWRQLLLLTLLTVHPICISICPGNADDTSKEVTSCREVLRRRQDRQMDIVDCLLLAKARHSKGRLLSFDKGLNRLAKG